jgi:hypothetical protein
LSLYENLDPGRFTAGIIIAILGYVSSSALHRIFIGASRRWIG